MTLKDKIKQLYPTLTDADFASPAKGTITLLNNSGTAPSGKVKVSQSYGDDYIESWNHPTLAQPTQAQLDAITE